MANHEKNLRVFQTSELAFDDKQPNIELQESILSDRSVELKNTPEEIKDSNIGEIQTNEKELFAEKENNIEIAKKSVNLAPEKANMIYEQGGYGQRIGIIKEKMTELSRWAKGKIDTIYNNDEKPILDSSQEQSDMEIEDNILEVHSGSETAALVEEQIKTIKSFHTKDYLLDSNVVLTQSGFKPQTESNVSFENDEEMHEVSSDIISLNKVTEDKNPEIRFRTVGKPQLNNETGKKTLGITVESLLGYERISKKTKIPGVPQFNKTRGFKQLPFWRSEMLSGLRRAQENGRISKDYNIAIIADGISKGYPDQAILDYAEWEAKGKKDGELQFSSMLNSENNGRPNPNFGFNPDHANDEAIKNNIKQGEKILNEFYNIKNFDSFRSRAMRKTK